MTDNIPGNAIRERLSQRGWTQSDLARVIRKTLAAVNEVIQGKRGITPEMAALLAAAFSDAPAYWLGLDAEHRANSTSYDVEHIRRRAKLYGLAPVRDMERRGWIAQTDDDASLECELKRFFCAESLGSEPSLGVAMRRSDIGDITPSQRAWCFRAFNIARTLHAKPFDPNKLSTCAQGLRALAAFPDESRKLPELLANFGIRFVIVEPLVASRIDGATMWLDDESPIIAVSARFDRIDSFWHTVVHEFVHVRNRDGSIDVDLAGEDQVPALAKTKIEREADEGAADLLVPRDKLESFIVRLGPIYAKSRIIQFANRVKMHPGIIVGQLQYRGEIGYRANRDMLVKIRNFVTATAATDGWGHSVPMEI